MRDAPVGTEVLDDPEADPALVTHMLHDIARLNFWLGGRAAARYGIARLLDSADRGTQLTLFDVGTGAGDLPLDAVRWAARRGVTLIPLALERIRAAAQLAHAAGLPVVIGSASDLPLKPASVDIVLISQVAHHLDSASATRLFRAASRAARRGVVIADLRPGLLAATGFRVACRALGMDRHTIADGVTSLQRGYRRDELRAACLRAGAANVRVAARPGARIVAWWRTG